MVTSISEYLAEASELFVKNQRGPRVLHYLEGIKHHAFGDAVRKAARGWHIACEIPGAFVKNGFRPWCHRDWSSRSAPGLEIETRQCGGGEKHTWRNLWVEI